MCMCLGIGGCMDLSMHRYGWVGIGVSLSMCSGECICTYVCW